MAGRHLLTKPSRDPTHHNLSSIIIRRCKDLSTKSPASVPLPSGPTIVLKGKADVRVGGWTSPKGTIAMARGVSRKLEEGNYRGAVRMLASDELIAQSDIATLRALREKHPDPPQDSRDAPLLDASTPQLSFDETAVKWAIQSFPAGSTGGIDGLTPLHLKDLINAEGQGSQLLTAVTALTNLMVNGGVPATIKPFIYGGRLIALNKKDGGVRPIVVGQVLRRIASKLVNRHGTTKLKNGFTPLQLGVGVPRGMEAAVHASRIFLENLDPDEALVKLDFKNAFNSLRRDSILEAAKQSLPEAYAYIHASYGSSSHLFYQDNIISSEVGVQQGDPLGPLLFCLCLQPILQRCSSDIRIGYLDDVTLGGKVGVIERDVSRIKEEGKAIGLVLNESKCEFVSSSSAHPTQSSCFPDFKFVSACNATLLGSPLLRDSAMDTALSDRVTSLNTAAQRLQNLQAHDALIILKHSLSLPSILHILRSSFCVNHPALTEFDNSLRNCLSQVLNVKLDDSHWIQATLPVKDGGLGIRRTVQVAPSAFLASASGSTTLVSAILSSWGKLVPDPSFDAARRAWMSQCSQAEPSGQSVSVQRCWDRPLIEKVKSELLAGAADDYSRARLLAAYAPHSGDWLNAPPLTAVGLRMNNETIRIASGLRLGVSLCSPHICPCKAQVDARGSHGLSCSQSAGRQQRHAQVNDIICRALVRAGVSARREPSGTVTGSGLRPDGASLIPWVRGKCLTWDATIVDTLAASHLPSTRLQAGAAAAEAALGKVQKYISLQDTYHFVPVAIETLGCWNYEGLELMREIGRRTSLITGDSRETSFLLQRIAIAVQRGNATSVRGSLPATELEEY